MSDTRQTSQAERGAAHATAGRTPVPQLRLPGQAAAPEGPVDAHMMYVMHHAFRRDLAMFADAAAVTPADDRDTWAALAERWRIFGEVLHHHHAGEDAGLWPRLLEVASPDERATLEAMEAEHAGIDPVLSECGGALLRLATAVDPATVADLPARLAGRLSDARDALGEHLRHEETDAMALVQKYLTTEDWHRLEEEHFRGGQPLSAVAAMVPWVAHGLPEHVRADLFAQAGFVMRLIWRLTHRRFERLNARARRHVA